MSTRVLVVEDSTTIRKRLCDVLASDPDIEVVGEAGDGKRAIELCESLRPDIVTMDMMLPLMSGLAATEHVMAHFPTPILIVSASVNRGEIFKTFDALAAGAVDVLDKPLGTEPDGEWERQFIVAVKLVSRIRVISHPRAHRDARSRALNARTIRDADQATTDSARDIGLVAVGASTGGPAAIVEVLRGLPTAFNLPLLFVMHINDRFGGAFADWLDSQTTRSVRFARDGETVTSLAGQVAMAPPDHHLIVQEGRLRLIEGPERHSCRPSVDVLFESIALDYGARAGACLLTGMGRDGAAGLLEIRRRGGVTIAQDEASSVVYGMPGAAAGLGAASSILALTDIGPALGRFCSVADQTRRIQG